MPGDPFRPAGSLFPTTAIRQKEHSEGPIEGRWAFNDMVYLMNSLLVKVNPTTPAGATNTRRWTFKPDNFGPNNLQTYTVEQGGAVAAERVVYALVQSLTMRATEEEASLTGTIIGKKTQEGITITGSPTDIPAKVVGPTKIAVGVGTDMTPDNEVQTITLGGPSAGTWLINFDGHTTAAIAFDATSAAVQSALTALPNVGVGGVTVTGSAGGPYTVTFGGLWLGFNAPAITLTTTGLTGGTPSVAQTTPGTITKLLRLHEFELAFEGRNTMGRTLDPSEESFSYTVERPPDATAQLVLQHDSVSQAFMDDMRAVTTKMLTVNAVGDTIEGNFPHRLQIRFPFLFLDTERADRNDVWAATYNLRPIYDGTFAGAIEVVIDCPLTAL